MTFDYNSAFKYPFNRKSYIKNFLIGSLCTFVIPLSSGYFLRAYGRVVSGIDNELPDWDDLVDLFSQGLIGLFIQIIYIIPPVIVMVIGYLMIGGGNGFVSSTGSISFIGMFLSLVILAGFLLFLLALSMLPMALAFYADTSDIMEALNISVILNKIFDNIEDYFTALIVFTAVTMSLLGIFFFILPVSIFYLNMFYAHLFGQIYRKDLHEAEEELTWEDNTEEELTREDNTEEELTREDNED